MSRIALVTGAVRGMRRAKALRLAIDGFIVAVNDINVNFTELTDTQKEIEKLGRKSFVTISDVSNEKAAEIMMKNVAKELGMANDGVCPIQSLIEIIADEWDRVLAVNLRGVFLCYKEAAKVMIVQGKCDKIIGACSMVGHMTMPLVSHHCARSVETQLADSCIEQMAAYGNVLKEEIYKGCSPKIPLGHIAKPDEIANCVSFLSSEESNYRIRQNVIIDGGFSLS
ncbi:unnamed protein product [Adineta steineri]|uniref:Uncharacterized protein n=1 Tax=Adineta steineri TaxID=433720 RepID=A0A820ANU8_9BILA|nr:unnamed protein product [Adineta steineri]CAF3701826.1 unnamed protein product [Adineta steineri]CAF4186178.1 unnamed protein product [Adineta steineri]